MHLKSIKIIVHGGHDCSIKMNQLKCKFLMKQLSDYLTIKATKRESIVHQNPCSAVITFYTRGSY